VQVYRRVGGSQATRSSEMSVDFQRSAQRYIPEDRTLHNHRRENLKYCDENENHIIILV
jgi:hypothetical protein